MVLNRVLAGQWTREEAAKVLGLSVRQVRRVLAAYEREGPAALRHGNRGRTPRHVLPPAVREQIVRLARGKYAGFNRQHLTEKLREVEEVRVGRTTVRRLLDAAGVPSPRTRRPPRHRRRRERMAQEGMLLQADGSPHDWLEGRGPSLTLIGGIDDATGQVPWALFREREDGQGYLLWLQHVILSAGIPLALYVDRHSIFEKSTREPLALEEELAGGRLPTQVSRVLQELEIERIAARSPQAKGRIERLWRTFQDRLSSELRLAGATTLQDANRVLWAWLPQFNARFAVPPAHPGSAYRPLPLGFSPEQVFCFKYTRVVAADNTVQFAQHRLQLLPTPQRASYARAEVEVHERLDGSLAVYFQGRCLATTPAPLEAPTLRARKLPRPGRPTTTPTAPTGASQTVTPPSSAPADRRPPAATHPWRRSFRQNNEPAIPTDGPPILPAHLRVPPPAAAPDS